VSAAPFTPEQQLRLLQVALRVKLRREGAPPEAVKLALSELEAGEQPALALAA
jgi:hypothetical protein